MTIGNAKAKLKGADKAGKVAAVLEEETLSESTMALEFAKFFRTAMLAKMLTTDEPYKETQLDGSFALALEAFEMWRAWLKDAAVEKFNEKVGLE
jgi:hypothetical protein